ncbi:MAG: Fpg/Nei family DNA glycosylase [Pseudomonadales bacterium]
MPELPDLTVYLEHIDARVAGERLTGIRLASPFVLRTVSPTVEEVAGLRLTGTRRLAKQLVLCLEDDFYLVIHLMIAGRLQWSEPGAPIPKRNGLAAFDFESGSILFTEASKKKRASLKLVQGRVDLMALDPGGLEVLDVDRATFAAQLERSNHTLKRALTDQHVFAGIGNAYSDEILLRARLSPFKRPSNLTDTELDALYAACRDVLTEWTARLKDEAGSAWPKKVTAFHKEMAVHGKYRSPCPVCGAPVQRIVYAENEANYCARCQTGGRLLADRSLSRLLKDNWPKRLEDLE